MKPLVDGATHFAVPSLFGVPAVQRWHRACSPLSVRSLGRVSASEASWDMSSGVDGVVDWCPSAGTGLFRRLSLAADVRTLLRCRRKAQVRGIRDRYRMEMRDRSRLTATAWGWMRDRVTDSSGYVGCQHALTIPQRDGTPDTQGVGAATAGYEPGEVDADEEPTHSNRPSADYRRPMEHLGGGRVVRLPEVMEITGLSRTTIWRRERDGSFPPPIRLGGEHTRAVGWREGDIYDWIDGLSPTA